MWVVMFLEVPKNVQRFHAFITKECYDIVLLDFRPFVTLSQIPPNVFGF
jgi:hypothetical protein